MPLAVLIPLVVGALAVLGIVYFAWRIEQDITEGVSPVIPVIVDASPVMPVIVIGAGSLLLWRLWRRV